jgi:biopolymer transport protein ExbD
MSMTTGAGGGLQNDINVTPMIDVLLVLLIIFMAAIPSMRKAIDLQLPDPTPQQSVAPSQSNQIVMEVGPNNYYALNKEVVPKENLAARLKSIYDGRPEKIIFVKGDPSLKYEDVIWAMDVARGSGVKVIGVPPKEIGAPAAAPAAKK